MKISDLNPIYDKMQKTYGASNLHAIYNGGCENRPDICFVFMNPTGKNIASDPQWSGLRAPWVGTKNIWKLFYRLGLLSQPLFAEIQKRKSEQWNAAFADQVYNDVTQHRYFITNLAKCTQPDARLISNAVYHQYLDLLCQEIKLLEPKIIVTFGNQVSSIVLDTKISVSQCRKQCFSKRIAGKVYPVYPVYYPVGNGMMNLDKAIEDLTYIIREIV